MLKVEKWLIVEKVLNQIMGKCPVSPVDYAISAELDWPIAAEALRLIGCWRMARGCVRAMRIV